MEWNINAIISIGALGVAIIALIDRFYGSGAKNREKIYERINGLESRVVTLETKTGPFWRILEEHMVDLLKQPIHLRMDALLDKYKVQRESMDINELTELKCELLNALEESKSKTNGKSEGRTFAYIVMLGILESRISEKIRCSCSEGGRELNHV